jgi:uncharacterized protein
MSRTNVETFLQAIDAMNRADLALHFFTEDVVFLPLRRPVSGDYRGHDGLREWFADTTETFDVFRADVPDVRDLGDRVLAIGELHIRGRGGGVETDVPTAGVATFRDGKIARWEDFGDRHLALEAVGLES